MLARAPSLIEGTAAVSEELRRTRGLRACAEAASRTRFTALSKATPSRSGNRGQQPFGAIERRDSDSQQEPVSKVDFSNGEAERPRSSDGLEPRVHSVFPHPGRHYCFSRTAPAIVRVHPKRGHCARAARPLQGNAAYAPNPSTPGRGAERAWAQAVPRAQNVALSTWQR